MHTRHPHEELLLKRSDKMKLVFWNRDPALQGLPRVAVSADFILNQDAFWEGKAEEDSKNGRSTGEGLAREWRQLHKTSYVIWTIRRRSSLAKLQQLVGLFTLPLHAVFYIRRRRHYTVDFSPIQRELDKERLTKQATANENPLPAVSEAPLCIF